MNNVDKNTHDEQKNINKTDKCIRYDIIKYDKC